MFAEKLELLNERIGDIVWGTPMVLLLIMGGIVLSSSSGFIQFRYFGHALRTALGGMFKKSTGKAGTITPFEAVCTALAGTIGTGNITGVMIAITLGGPGAVFWMWMSALVGMGIKFAEIVLAVKFREKGRDGYSGGPMYYIKNGLSRKWSFLGTLFCIFGSFAAFGIGNMMQMGSILTAVQDTVSLFLPALSGGREIKLLLGGLMALLCGITMSGGAKSRGRVAAFLVPVMAAFYIIGALFVIGINIDRLPSVLGLIIRDAFSGTAVLGVAAGGAVKRTMSWGFKRGMFSNEAGLGSSPIAHASADTDSPVKQGFLGIFEVFADTIVICTLTALMVLVSDIHIDYGTVGGAELCTQALAAVFGKSVSSIFMSSSIMLFAFSSIVGWSLYGERCAEYLLGGRVVPVYRAFFVLVTFLSTSISFTFIIRMSDTMNALMILPNMMALLMLVSAVKKETALYLKSINQKKSRPH